MINLDKKSASEMLEQLNNISYSLNNCAHYFELDREVMFFQKFINYILRFNFFENEEYLKFADRVVSILYNDTKNISVITLLVDLSRVDSEVAEIYKKYKLISEISEAIITSPSSFSTPFNEIMVSDYVYGYYYNSSKKILLEKGVEGFIHYLKKVHIKTVGNYEYITPSIISSIVSIYFFNDKLALQKLMNNFGYINSVEKKISKLLSSIA